MTYTYLVWLTGIPYVTNIGKFIFHYAIVKKKSLVIDKINRIVEKQRLRVHWIRKSETFEPVSVRVGGPILLAAFQIWTFICPITSFRLFRFNDFHCFDCEFRKRPGFFFVAKVSLPLTGANESEKIIFRSIKNEEEYFVGELQLLTCSYKNKRYHGNINDCHFLKEQIFLKKVIIKTSLHNFEACFSQKGKA